MCVSIHICTHSFSCPFMYVYILSKHKSTVQVAYCYRHILYILLSIQTVHVPLQT